MAQSSDEEALVQPTTTYMEGREHKHAGSKPYPVPRHHAVELEGHGFARIVGPKKGEPVEPVEDPEEGDESDVEQPDDTSDMAAAADAQPAPRRRGRPPGKKA